MQEKRAVPSNSLILHKYAYEYCTLLTPYVKGLNMGKIKLFLLAADYYQNICIGDGFAVRQTHNIGI